MAVSAQGFLARGQERQQSKLKGSTNSEAEKTPFLKKKKTKKQKNNKKKNPGKERETPRPSC
jgi:hypothetical protein